MLVLTPIHSKHNQFWLKILWGGSSKPEKGHRILFNQDFFLLCAAVPTEIVVVPRVTYRGSASVLINVHYIHTVAVLQ